MVLCKKHYQNVGISLVTECKHCSRDESEETLQWIFSLYSSCDRQLGLLASLLCSQHTDDDLLFFNKERTDDSERTTIVMFW